MSRRHVVHVLTVADSLVFIDTLVATAKARGFDVTVVTSPDERLDAFGRKLRVNTVGVPMPRRITPAGDWRALETLHRLMLDLRPGVVHAHTPKGGLLGTLAAQAAGVPVRLYHMRGLAFLTLRGLVRTVLTTTERVACSAATRVVCQSPSLRELALAHGLTTPDHISVVLGGSNGIDLDRYRLEERAELGAALRTSLGLGPDVPIIGFVGRVVRDKGIGELLEAFEQLSGEPHLVVAGPLEERDAVPAETVARLRGHPRVHHLGFVADPRPVYAASDVVVLPSHREGFPNVPLEAAALARPVVTTTAPGCIDAVEDGRTGTQVPVGDVTALGEAIQRYLGSAALRAAHGEAGRARVERSFRREAIAAATVDLYESHVSGSRASRAT